MNDEHELEAYRQSIELFRHYANMRFATLTAFIAITGGLFAIAVTDDGARFFGFLGGAGVVVAAVFATMEMRIDELMTYFAKNAYRIAAGLDINPIAKKKPELTFYGKLSGRPAMLTIYLGSIGFWVFAILIQDSF